MASLSSSFLPNNFLFLSAASKKPSFFHDNHHIHLTHKLISNALNTNSTKPTKSNSFRTTLFNSVDDFICNHLDLPLHQSVDPRSLLTGNLSPVPELPPTACAIVKGTIPACLDGAYIRNGPNSQFVSQNGPVHLFDGDGMLHMIRISKGQATFCSRYVKTYKYLLEREAGHTIIPSAFSSFNGILASAARIALMAARVVFGDFNPMVHGMGTANTNVPIFDPLLNRIEFDKLDEFDKP